MIRNCELYKENKTSREHFSGKFNKFSEFSTWIIKLKICGSESVVFRKTFHHSVVLLVLLFQSNGIIFESHPNCTAPDNIIIQWTISRCFLYLNSFLYWTKSYFQIFCTRSNLFCTRSNLDVRVCGIIIVRIKSLCFVMWVLNNVFAWENRKNMEETVTVFYISRLESR